jgi:hypothetical protein
MSMTDRRVFLSSLAATGATALGGAQELIGSPSRGNGAGQATGNPQSTGARPHTAQEAIFNIRDYGATGIKSDDAGSAIQKAINACAAAGGGTVYLPPGEYTSGGLKLRSHVRIYLEGGATLLASDDPHAYPLINVTTWGENDALSTAAVFQGDNLEDVSIEGRGTVDGQATFIWRPDTTERAFINKQIMQRMGKSLMRSYPTGFPTRQIYPHLVWLHRCKDVRITGLSFLRSPSWTFYLFECERVVVDGIYAHTSLKEAVWCDGIDMNGCSDVHISNSTIETGDDCIAMFSSDRACENITIVNCRFSSASAAIKFTEGVKVAVQKVVIDNCVITDCNRGITLQIVDGGTVRDVIISNLTMDLHRFAWFWAGHGNPFNFEIKTPSEWNQQPPQPGDPGPGRIHNVTIRNIIAHVQGSSNIAGHRDPNHWLEGVTFEDIKLFLSTDPAAAYDTSVHALKFRWARNLKVKGVEVFWEKPALDKWQSALYFADIDGLELNDFTGRQAWRDSDIPAVVFNKVANARVINSKAAEGTKAFLSITGEACQDICLQSNDFRKAQVPYKLSDGARSAELQAMSNLLPST